MQKRQPGLDPKRLVFIDETSVSTTIARLYGWAPQGERLVQKLPHGNWKTITFIAALRHDRVTAPFVLEGPMTGDGRDGCRIGLIPIKEYDVRVGDTVYASAKLGLLDTPIVIGEVAQVKPDRNTPVLWDIHVRPIFPARLTEIAVIVMVPQEKED